MSRLAALLGQLASPRVEPARVGCLDSWAGPVAELRDGSGQLVVRVSQRGSCVGLECPASWRADVDLAAGATRLTAVSTPPPADLIFQYRRLALPLLVQVAGFEVLHASAVRTGAGVVAFAGVSGVGKSTLAARLVRRGFELWADDTVVFDVEQGGPVTVCLPSSALPDGSTEVLPLAGVALLRRADAQGGSLQLLAPTRALPTLLTHALAVELGGPERRAKLVESYCGLAEHAIILDLALPQLSSLETVLDDLERWFFELASSRD